MPDNVVLLSIPGLRGQDLDHMPALRGLTSDGDRAALAASFPAVTLPVQANMTTGLPPSEHGVVANGYFWRDTSEVEMWTAWNDKIQRPQLWDLLHEHDASITSAVWFPMFAKGCGADYVCLPAPVHNPDGSESLWCYTKPQMLYGDLRDALGHFPLQNFWGPMASVASTKWIVDSAVWTAQQHQPNFFFVYLPHLDYAAQKHGPDSSEGLEACCVLDEQIARLVAGFADAYDQPPLWLAASEYVIRPVSQVAYPNRALRDAGLMNVTQDADGRELIDFAGTPAWALVDHQIAHVFVRDHNMATTSAAVDALSGLPGVAEVLTGDDRGKYDLVHERSGDIILVADPDAWFAYYYWRDDNLAPAFARSVDIHRKPGYDPVEMYLDPAAMQAGLGPTPLDTSLVKGSHGAPPVTDEQRGVILSSQRGAFVERTMTDTDVADLVLRQFGV
ncbi:Type I phosphodiesterase / nucleotide pyrophosphatase [Posidoniimonas polymericola]|uniref:Type I phosphodiesterase / nucleotide pyrophosphatase n=1 Tax=Posidoniimonas polymericola TaxID=2528002 RepID=A0A5C5YMD2_9BACT|nr:nucleotide pyrophosphatase/phosphodiesterase family protein [Posidoniimonas polymericola]TWT75989.1 Type I phosphodiesterase / nucleotide pyrophosphatase [Posidoniimonas polymericola]